jgi:predicted ATPase/DNA-binding CsgD family transcriptional regulator
MQGNIPAALTSFVGRGHEMAEVTRLLGQTRLLTLTGPGGVGKTRLALAVAAALTAVYAAGVWLVELAALAEPELVAQAVAWALGLREAGPRPVLDTLIEWLRDRQVLLVLDNCEHLADSCAELCVALLASCPRLRILATSRQSLRGAGETVWTVPPLSVACFESGQALDSEATRLFVERAGATLPTFDPDHQRAPAISQICTRLDGIPLAIELAAAWTNVLSVEEIAGRLDDRFRFLTGGSRTALPRQQTLRRTMDWSYGLLQDDERVLLQRLAVFEGGWTLEAAEACCAAEPLDQGQILGTLARLIDKSLVLADTRQRQGRYALLDTTRQYGAERLIAAGEESDLRRRHGGYFLELAQRAERELLGPAQVEWMRRLDAERENLRAVRRWAIESGDTDAEIRLCAALWEYWWMRGYLSEGRDSLEAALGRAVTRASNVRARARHGLALLTALRGDLESATNHFAASVAEYRDLGDQAGLVRPLTDLGPTHWLRGDGSTGHDMVEQSLAQARQVGAPWSLAYALHCLAQILLGEDRLVDAAEVIEEGVQRWRALGDRRGLAHDLLELAAVTRRRGEAGRATEVAREALQLFWELGETWGLEGSLIRLAASAAASQRSGRAARLLGAAEALAETIGSAMIMVNWRADLDWARGRAEAVLTPTAFEALRGEGRSMPLDRVVGYALADSEPPPGALLASLTAREREVLTLLELGSTDRQIAEKLVISERTAESHVHHVLRKLGLHSRIELRG